MKACSLWGARLTILQASGDGPICIAAHRVGVAEFFAGVRFGDGRARWRWVLRSMTRSAVLIVLLSLFGCGTVLPERGPPSGQVGSVNATGMVACQFAAAHHPSMALEKMDRTRGDASATARRGQQAAAEDCDRQLTRP